MGFGQILFLAGLAAVVGPILIHLLIRPRFRRVAHTMLDFLEVSQKQSRRTRRLREWLILLMRCAIVALLACMFALPFMKLRAQTPSRPDRYFIVLDNSLSMTYQDQGRPLLDRAIERAVQYVVQRQTGSDLFDVWTACGGHLGSKLGATEAVATLKSIVPTARPADMTDVLAAVGVAIGEHENTAVHWVSDFTPAAMKGLAQCPPMKGLRKFSYEPITAREPANALVKKVRVLRVQNGVVELLATVENSGTVAQKRGLRASIRGGSDEATTDEVAVELAPARSAEFVLKLNPGELTAGQDSLPVEISLSPPDALVADDTYLLGVQIESTPQPRVLIAGRSPEQGFLIQEALKAISRADFDNNLIVRLNQGPALDEASLDRCDILMCGHITPEVCQDIEALDRFLVRGGTAVFFVGRDMSLPIAQRLYRAGIIGAEPFELIDARQCLSERGPSDSVFSRAGLDVDTARAIRSYTLDHMPLWSHFACRQHPESTSLWPIETGHYLVYTLARGAGKSLLINTSMDDAMSSLTKQPVVIPLCRLILGGGHTAYGYGFGAEEQVMLPAFEFEQGPAQADQGIWVLDPSGERRHMAVTGSSLTGHFPEHTGWLRTLSDPVRYAGINVAAGETDLHARESAEIERCLAGLSKNDREPGPADLAATTVDSRRPLWRVLAWVTLGLVMAEGLVVNRVKR